MSFELVLLSVVIPTMYLIMREQPLLSEVQPGMCTDTSALLRDLGTADSIYGTYHTFSHIEFVP